MTIFVDAKYRCHISPEEGMTEIETDVFNGKSPTYIEGYRFVPYGQSWIREDGEVFRGEMVSPAVPVEPLLIAQAEYERTQASMMKAYQKGVNSV